MGRPGWLEPGGAWLPEALKAGLESLNVDVPFLVFFYSSKQTQNLLFRPVQATFFLESIFFFSSSFQATIWAVEGAKSKIWTEKGTRVGMFKGVTK